MDANQALSGDGFDYAYDIAKVHILAAGGRARNHFNFSFGCFLADIHSEGNSDKVSILELYSGTFVTIIQQYVQSRCFQVCRNLLSCFNQLCVCGIGHRYHHVERSN